MVDHTTRESPAPCWRLGTRRLVLDRPRIMAILNATPDSFSDGGLHLDPNAAAEAAMEFVRAGADMLDVGGESTRPGAARISADEQIARVMPVIRAIRRAGLTVPISVDTTRSAVAEAAIDAGADAINDVSGGDDDPELVAVAARHGCGLVLMHRLRPPEHDAYSDKYSAENRPAYSGGVVAAVRAAMLSKASDAIARGVARDAIVVDPGLGFGKTVEQNLELVRGSASLVGAGFPVLGAASRKSFVGRISLESGASEPSGPGDRLEGSIAMSLVQLFGGVRLFRVHDVAAQSRALRSAWRVFAA